MDEETVMSDEDALRALDALANTTGGYKESLNTHTFLNAVATATDTIKVGNLKEEEVGIPKLSVRTLKELELYSKEVACDDDWASYFNKRAEILTSTSLSKEAKLLDLSVVNRVETANTTKQPRRENKSWFKRREQPQQM